MKKKIIVQFGRYPVDAEGKVVEPISWIVLEKTKEKMVMISEQILDYKEFSANGKNDWEQSDLKKWLNEEFFSQAFNDEEKAKMNDFGENEKVSLISFDDTFNTSYFPNLKSFKAKYTDYAKNKTKNIYGKVTTYEFGFWWLKSANVDYPLNPHQPFDTTIYVFHICNNGRLNGYMLAKNKEGVRPVICVTI